MGLYTCDKGTLNMLQKSSSWNVSQKANYRLKDKIFSFLGMRRRLVILL